MIGHITLGMKQTGERNAGKPHVAFDAAGAGNGFTNELMRHSQRKRGATDRLALRMPRQFSTLPPDSIDAHFAAGNQAGKPFEIWHYRSVQIEGPAAENWTGSGYTAPNAVVRKDVDFRFVDECACGQYRLMSPWPTAAAAELSEPHSAASIGEHAAKAQQVSEAPASRQGSVSSGAESHSDVRVQVRTLHILSSDLPESTKAQISSALSGGTYSLDVLAELVREQLRNRGYAEAQADVQNVAALRAAPPAHPVDVSVRAVAGAQYRLGAIVIEGAHAFSEKQILQQFPIHPGDLFDTAQIVKGFENLKKLYAAKGYTHFGAIPSPQMDEKQRTVTLTLKIEEGTPVPRG